MPRFLIAQLILRLVQMPFALVQSADVDTGLYHGKEYDRDQNHAKQTVSEAKSGKETVGIDLHAVEDHKLSFIPHQRSTHASGHFADIIVTLAPETATSTGPRVAPSAHREMHLARISRNAAVNDQRNILRTLLGSMKTCAPCLRQIGRVKSVARAPAMITTTA